jgi:Ca2+-binding RTX toxin-like protein
LTGLGTTGEAAGDSYNSIEVVRGSLCWDVFTYGNSGGTFFGFDGNDLFNGGTGNDVLDGGNGADVMFGGLVLTSPTTPQPRRRFH